MMMIKKISIIVLLTALFAGCDPTSLEDQQNVDGEVRDVSWFLKRMRSVDHLPILENSHTAMVSTWDTTGGNMDAFTHNWKVEGNTNTILDIDGPGCIHRIFTGFIDERFDNTQIQIYLDHSETPLFDMPITEFFDDRYSPFTYPLVFVKSYPGSLMPIPFEKNIKVQVVTRPYRAEDWIHGPIGEADWNQGRWGVFWQFTYTKYREGTRVKSLDWPLSDDEQTALEKTCQAWVEAESAPPPEPAAWSHKQGITLQPGEALQLTLENAGVIEEMRISASPDKPEVLNNLRIRMFWDDCPLPSVDVPLGYMFGHGEAGHNRNDSSIAAVLGKWPKSEIGNFMQTQPQPYNTNYYSLLMGMNDEEVYSKFPMPYSEGARIEIVNTGSALAGLVGIKLDVKKMMAIPANWGRFQVTWSQAPAATEAIPKFGIQNVPGKVFLSRRGRGKYVGSMLQVEWPYEHWWGEGDWFFWTDENEWPPSYHGTGSEEYFNSGWCMFDRKAVSGFVDLRPGFPTVYSFHMNDGFNFQENITVVEEQWGWENLADLNPMWSSTAFWYSAFPTGAESMQ